jgi:hypothetical protein
MNSHVARNVFGVPPVPGFWMALQILGAVIAR